MTRTKEEVAVLMKHAKVDFQDLPGGTLATVKNVRYGYRGPKLRAVGKDMDQAYATVVECLKVGLAGGSLHLTFKKVR